MDASQPFLDEIEQEHHKDLLETGNLRPQSRPSWSDENRWTSQGYLARVQRTRCTCGAVSDSLLGIFHQETTPSGKSREVALNPQTFLQFPPGHSGRVIVQEVSARFCPTCLRSKGFESF